MSEFNPFRMFTWRRLNHEVVEKRYGWPPFGWKTVEGPELAPEAYYDADDVLAISGILLRTRPLRRSGMRHIEALRADVNGPFINIERDEIEDLITYHFQYSTGATTVRHLDSLCVMNTTRTVFEVKEKFRGVERKFRVVLDKTEWGHKVGMVVLLAGGGGDGHAQIDAFMARHPNFFDTFNVVKVTMASWEEINGITSP